MSITESTFLVSNAIAQRLADIQFGLADFSRYASGYISFDGAQECQERLTAIIDGVRQCREDLQQETAAPPSTAADRIYISGPMTGLPDLNFPAFHAAAAALRAKGWLAAGLPAAEVAAACGLADQSHLNRAFLRRYGTTPVRYQKQVQAGR